MSATPRVARLGQTLTIRYTTTGRSGRRIGILPAHGTRPIVTLPILDGTDHLAAFFGTRPLGAGSYRAALLGRDGAVQASSPFWVLPRGARPRISAARRSFAAGEPIRLRWRNAPGNKLDWVGIYRAGPLDVYGYLGFSYLGARPHGTAELRARGPVREAQAGPLRGGAVPGRRLLALGAHDLPRALVAVAAASAVRVRV